MSTYAARKLVEAAFTVAAVNAQIDALNTIYGTSIAHIATVKSGMEVEPSNLQPTDFPTLLTMASAKPGEGEIKSQGKRDDHVSVDLTYLGHEPLLATAQDTADILAEAFRPIIETLDSAQYASSHRYCVQCLGLMADVARFDTGGTVYRIGARVKFTMLMRTEGL